MAFPCACTNVTTTGFPGGPLTPPCPAADAAKTIGDQTITNLPTPPPVPRPVALSGGDFFVTGPAALTVTFSVTRTDVTCPVSYQVTVDGNPVGTAFAVAAGTANTVNGTATVSIPTGIHDIGLAVNIPAGECIEHILSGSMTVHAECVGNFTPVFIGA